jgi:hypothetical protein
LGRRARYAEELRKAGLNNDLDELQRLARTFDGIGDEVGGARYPAVAFVRWLADEYAATGRRPLTGDEAA